MTIAAIQIGASDFGFQRPWHSYLRDNDNNDIEICTEVEAEQIVLSGRHAFRCYEMIRNAAKCGAVTTLLVSLQHRSAPGMAGIWKVLKGYPFINPLQFFLIFLKAIMSNHLFV